MCIYWSPVNRNFRRKEDIPLAENGVLRHFRQMECLFFLRTTGKTNLGSSSKKKIFLCAHIFVKEYVQYFFYFAICTQLCEGICTIFLYFAMWTQLCEGICTIFYILLCAHNFVKEYVRYFIFCYVNTTLWRNMYDILYFAMCTQLCEGICTIFYILLCEHNFVKEYVRYFYILLCAHNFEKEYVRYFFILLYAHNFVKEYVRYLYTLLCAHNIVKQFVRYLYTLLCAHNIA